jgi:hypothetical protein
MNLRTWLVSIVWLAPAVARLPALRAWDNVGKKDPVEGRRLIQVGKNDCAPGQPGNEGCEPRGWQEVPCEEAVDENGDLLFDGDVCGFPSDVEGSTYCIWYGGFTEYECGCDRKETSYCKDESNVFCIPGYEPTQMTLNGGRVFWSCNPNPKPNP